MKTRILTDGSRFKIQRIGPFGWYDHTGLGEDRTGEYSIVYFSSLAEANETAKKLFDDSAWRVVKPPSPSPD